MTLLDATHGTPVELAKPVERPFKPRLPKGPAVPGSCVRHNDIIECARMRCFDLGGELACYQNAKSEPEARIKPIRNLDRSTPPAGPLPHPFFWMLELADGTSCSAAEPVPENQFYRCDGPYAVRDSVRVGEAWAAVVADVNGVLHRVPVKAVWR